MDDFSLLINKIEKEIPIISYNEFLDNYVLINIDTSKLLRSVTVSSYIILLESDYMDSIKKKENPRNILLRDIRKNTKDNRSKFTILIVNEEKFKNYLIKILSEFHDLRQFPIFITTELLKPEKPLQKIIISLLLNYPYENFFKKLIPYSIDSIPRRNMFYGRKETINYLIESENNIIITGARRIGKTTLAYNLSDSLGTIPTVGIKVLNPKIKKCAVIDVSNLLEYENDIWEKILQAFNYDESLYMPYARKERGKKVFENYIRSVEELLDSYNGELVIVLDEVDNWIVEDAKNDWKILNPLRSLTDRGKAKVVLIGYETLQNILLKHDFPLLGRYELLKLKPLGRDEVELLIKEPLLEIGVSIDKGYESELIEQIWRLSGGRPNLVQGFCLELALLLGEEEDKIIRQTHFQAAERISYVYREYLESIVLGGSYFARLICGISAILMSKNNTNTIALSDIILEIESLAYDYDEEEYRIALLQLDLRHLLISLNREIGLYRFTSEIIKKEFLKLIEIVGYERWAQNLLKRHKKSN